MSVNFKYFNLNQIHFEGTDDKSGGVILMIGDDSNNNSIINKLKELHNVKVVHNGINSQYLRDKKLEEKLEREFVLTNLVEANKNIDILVNAGHFRVIIFILLNDVRITKISTKLSTLIDYVFCSDIMKREPMQLVYNSFIYMFKHDWDFFKFVFMQIKLDDWLVVHSASRTAMKPEDYIYFYSELEIKSILNVKSNLFKT